jgi:pseudouridine synthase
VTRESAEVADDGRIRLNRFLATAGICSRRSADVAIAKGRVMVNGEVVTQLGLRIDPAEDDVRCDEQRVRPELPVYVLFNKPKGVVCTNARNEVRKRVIDFLENVRGRLYTVGRLDAESEGLVLLTNDGDFAQSVAHPRFGVSKTYAVLVRGRLTREEIKKVRGGVWLAEGRTGGARIRVERLGRDRTYLKVQIQEGKNREVRRVFARLGHPVISLKRVRIGSLTLHGLGVGKHRFLTRAEVGGLVAQPKKVQD